MRNLTHRWRQPGHFCPKLGHFFPIFEKGQGRPPHSPPPLVTRLINSVLLKSIKLFFDRALQFVTRNRKKSAIKAFHRKNYFPLFCGFVYNLKSTVWKHLMRINYFLYISCSIGFPLLIKLRSLFLIKESLSIHQIL